MVDDVLSHGVLESPIAAQVQSSWGTHAQATMYAARLMIPWKDVMAMKLFGMLGSGKGESTQSTYLVFLTAKALDVAPSNFVHGI